MLLSAILKNIVNANFPDCEITGINLDSRLVKPGDLFIAYRGEKEDGHTYVDAAIAQGAKAILCENESAAKDRVPIEFPMSQVQAEEIQLLEPIQIH